MDRIDAAGVVLAGGRSSRMGTSKAALSWQGSTLLHRTVSVLAEVVGGPVVVVASPGQELPALRSGTTIVEDPIEGLGPMQGIATGLDAVAADAWAAFVCSTDMPFLHPAFVRRVLGELASNDVDVVLPLVRDHRQPLAAAYLTSLADTVRELVAAGRLATGMLFERCVVREIDEAELLADPELAKADPNLDSVININTPEDYAAAQGRLRSD
ncbi:MAG TPA: molybdenum cofactor guanylyltransferase [Ilumatobacteraceae bacterium]|nr:molybdenum cofactor guanylyltransferase [Ilumatobacteraceae bacterium]